MDKGSKLGEIVKYAHQKVPHYNKVFNNMGIKPELINSIEDLQKLPVLLKDEVQALPDEFISTDYKFYPQRENIIINRTSGSTGKMLEIYWSKQDLIRSLYYLWFIRTKKYGIEPSSRCCTFHSSVYRNNRIVDSEDIMYFNKGQKISFSKLMLDEKHLQMYYEKMVDFGPQWIFSQPGITYLMAQYISENMLKPPESLKYIELSGEFLFENFRKKIQEVFGVPVVNMYGCNEANGIAVECSEGKLHCLSNNVIVEVLKNGCPVEMGQEGEIHITCLTNTAMPFIRYAVGDKGILLPPEACGCGNANPVLEIRAGRLGEYIFIDEKRRMDCFVLAHTVENMNIKLRNIINQFKVIQEGYKKFTVLFVLEEGFGGWKETVSKTFEELIAKAGIKDAHWDIKFVNAIAPDVKTGKLQFFKNNMKEE